MQEPDVANRFMKNISCICLHSKIQKKITENVERINLFIYTHKKKKKTELLSHKEKQAAAVYWSCPQASLSSPDTLN